MTSANSLAKEKKSTHNSSPIKLFVVVSGERDEVLEAEHAVEGARPHDLGLLRFVRNGQVVRVPRHVLQQAAEGRRAAVLVDLEVGLTESVRVNALLPDFTT